MPKHILVAMPVDARQKATLQSAAPGLQFRFTGEPACIDDVLWADAVLGNLPIELIRQNDHLEWFQSNFAGPDAYLAPGVLPPQCIITNATGAYGLAISEWMLGMWLGLLKDLFLYRDNQHAARWAAIERPVRSIAGSRVVCVGLGDIGSNFARRAHALGATVVGVRSRTPDPAQCPDYCLRVVGPEGLDAELAEADLVALCLPGTAKTARLFDAARLARIRPGAILINVGRGNAVDNDALAAALQNGALFAAALDVTDPEPLPPDHTLWRLPNVLITPHISGRFSLPQTKENIVQLFAHNLRRYAAGEVLDNQVSRSGGYVTADTPGSRLVCE